MSDHPFVPGARVAITSRYSDDVREGFVDKVYKTGRFTLRGSKQQWKPYCWSGERWSASERTSRIVGRDKEISERIAKTKLRQRWLAVRRAVATMPDNPGEEVIAAIEAALAATAKVDA